MLPLVNGTTAVSFSVLVSEPEQREGPSKAGVEWFLRDTKSTSAYVNMRRQMGNSVCQTQVKMRHLSSAIPS